MMTGEEHPDQGQVAGDRGVTIGYFSQDVGEMAGRSAAAEVMDGAGPISAAATELKELEHAMADPRLLSQMCARSFGRDGDSDNANCVSVGDNRVSGALVE